MAEKRNIPGVIYVKDGTNLCQFEGFSCFGCCGYSFKGKEKAIRSLTKQTLEFKSSLPGREEKIRFRDRMPSTTLNSCNFCFNLVLKADYSQKQLENDRKIDTYCPFHPALNDGEELREGHCEHDYMCKTQIFFHSLDNAGKEKFESWLKKRVSSHDIDWYTYSVGMDTNLFLKEYMNSNEKKRMQ